MGEFTIFIGNKTYSSWSLRGWLALKLSGAPFEEVVLPLNGPGSPTKEIVERSPSGRVPLLKHRDLLVWDSLAIGEYLAELFPSAGLWPADARARATARAVSAEMHSGFASLRSAMPMNVRREPIELPVSLLGDVKNDIARIVALWSDCRRTFGAGGPYLFGRYSFADAMFAPVATRFRTYGVSLDEGARAYVDASLTHPAVQEWISAAKREPWRIEGYEIEAYGTPTGPGA
jgi:glutathione S-transferase